MSSTGDEFTFTWNSDDALPPWLGFAQPIYSREIGHSGYMDEPISLNYGFGERVFTVADCLKWAEREAEEKLWGG